MKYTLNNVPRDSISRIWEWLDGLQSELEDELVNLRNFPDTFLAGVLAGRAELAAELLGSH